jgi:hypothetical protein
MRWWIGADLFPPRILVIQYVKTRSGLIPMRYWRCTFKLEVSNFSMFKWSAFCRPSSVIEGLLCWQLGARWQGIRRLLLSLRAPLCE